MRRLLVLAALVVGVTAGKPESATISIHGGVWQLEVVQTDSLRPQVDADTVCVDIAQIQPAWDQGRLVLYTNAFSLDPAGDSTKVLAYKCMSVGCANTDSASSQVAQLSGGRSSTWRDATGVATNYVQFIFMNNNWSGGNSHGYHVIIQAKAIRSRGWWH